MKKILSYILIFCAVAIALATYFWNDVKSRAPKEPITIDVKKTDINEKASATGVITPKNTLAVKSQVSGIAGQIFHKAGEPVKKNEKLAQIIPPPTPQIVSESIKQVQADRAAVKIDQSQLENFQHMLDTKIVRPTYKPYVEAKQKLTKDKAQLKKDEAQLAAAQKKELEDKAHPAASYITSPIDGYVIKANVKTGDQITALTAGPAADTLFTVGDMKDLVFRGQLKSRNAASLQKGMNANITLQNDKNTVIPGILSELTPSLVINQLKIPGTLKMQGEYKAKADVFIKTVKNALIIPKRVIFYKNEKPYVKLAEKRNHREVEQGIEIGISDGENVQVLKGLSAGQKIVDSKK